MFGALFLETLERLWLCRLISVLSFGWRNMNVRNAFSNERRKRTNWRATVKSWQNSFLFILMWFSTFSNLWAQVIIGTLVRRCSRMHFCLEKFVKFIIFACFVKISWRQSVEDSVNFLQQLNVLYESNHLVLLYFSLIII